ncbi:MAG: hypothetical protein EOP84_20270 [Verrucomicrobiaceae bacterium]|nr:MAG: hypothetical protein EOP84_20270 [Verrucomicrobiaceae bacterium]
MRSITKSHLQEDLDNVTKEVEDIKLKINDLSSSLLALLNEQESLTKLMELRGWMIPSVDSERTREEVADYSAAVEMWMKSLVTRVVTTSSFALWLTRKHGIAEPNRNAIRSLFEKMKEQGYLRLRDEGQGRTASSYVVALKFLTAIKAGKCPLSKGDIV